MIFCTVKESGQIFLPICYKARVCQTDNQTDGRTDRQTVTPQRGMSGSNCPRVKCPWQIVWGEMLVGKVGGISRGIRFKFRFISTELVARRLKMKQLNICAVCTRKITRRTDEMSRVNCSCLTCDPTHSITESWSNL